MKTRKITAVLFIMIAVLVSCSGSSSIKALFAALENNAGLDEITKRLNSGVDINAVNSDGMTPLMYAISMESSPEVVSALIEAGADVNAVNAKTYETVLSYSVNHNAKLDTIATLLEAGEISVDYNNQSLMSELLYKAIDFSSPILISVLINAGVDPNKAYNDNDCPLVYALRQSASPEVLTALIESGAKIVNDYRNFGYPLEYALMNANLETVTVLIGSGIDVNYFDSFTKKGLTPLQYAARNSKDSRMISALLEAGADVKANNPLGYATNIENLTVLLEAGADVNIGKPLMLLVSYDTTNAEMVKKMIEAGADANLGNPLWSAAKYSSDPRIITTLIDAGADVRRSKDILGEALKSNRHAGVLLALINSGINVNDSFPLGYNDRTPLPYAIEKQLGMDIVSALIEAGANVNVRDGNWTSLAYAIRMNDIEAVKALLSAGADVNAQFADKLSSLLYAAQVTTSPEIITLLIDAGANVNVMHRNTNYMGVETPRGTPLFYAAKETENPEVIDSLLDAGADTRVIIEGKRAIDWAKQNEYLVNTPAYKRLEALSQSGS